MFRWLLNLSRLLHERSYYVSRALHVNRLCCASLVRSTHGLVSAFFPLGRPFGTSRPNILACGLRKQPGSFLIGSHYCDSQYRDNKGCDLHNQSLSSVVGWGRSLQNHWGLLNWQQVLRSTATPIPKWILSVHSVCNGCQCHRSSPGQWMGHSFSV